MEYFSIFLTLVLVMHQPERRPGGATRASTERGLGPSGTPDARASLPSLGPVRYCETRYEMTANEKNSDKAACLEQE